MRGIAPQLLCIALVVILHGGCSLLFSSAAEGGDAATSCDDSSALAPCHLVPQGAPELVIRSGAAQVFDTTSGALLDEDSIAILSLEMVTLDGNERVAAVLASRIVIERGAQVRAVGDFPLALIASEDIFIDGQLSASSTVELAGAGAQGAHCEAAGDGDFDASFERGSGGAGGSFGGQGGDGGSLGDALGGDAAARSEGSGDPLFVHGGCEGGLGGYSGAPAARAPGGGSLHLLAGSEIVIDGVVAANGAGGRGGGAGTGAGKNVGGGNGGGSGGLIVLDAPQVRLQNDATVVAKGGGGGSGTSGSTSGSPGSDGTYDREPSPGGTEINTPGGGAGGISYLEPAEPGGDLTGGFGSAGGGGGGAGFVLVAGELMEEGIVAPKPVISR